MQLQSRGLSQMAGYMTSWEVTVWKSFPDWFMQDGRLHDGRT